MRRNAFVQHATGRVVKYLKPASRGSAQGLVAEVYDQAEKELALVPPISLHTPSPEILAGIWMVTREAFVVGRAGCLRREIVAAAVSQTNSCLFCVEVHRAMLHGGGKHRLADDLLNEDEARQTADPLAQWALATRTPGPTILTRPPFAAAEAPHIIGTTLLFHCINRMVNVFLESSPSPVKTLLLKAAFSRILGAVIGRRLIRVDVAPGSSLPLLHNAPLPSEFAWAEGSAAIAGALGRFSAVIDAAGEQVVPVAARAVVLNEVGAWNGEDPGLSPSWIKVALAPWMTRRRAPQRIWRCLPRLHRIASTSPSSAPIVAMRLRTLAWLRLRRGLVGLR